MGVSARRLETPTEAMHNKRAGHVQVPYMWNGDDGMLRASWLRGSFSCGGEGRGWRMAAWRDEHTEFRCALDKRGLP